MSTLQEQLQAAQDQLAAAQKTEAADEAALTADESSITAIQATIADLEAQIAAATTKTLGGCWCQSGGWNAQEKLAVKMGFKTQIGRASNSEGQPDATLLGDDTIAAIVLGYLPSLQFQPKTGSGGDRVGIPYQDVIDGKYDAWILSELAKIVAHVPAGAKLSFENKSEFDIPHTATDPKTGKPEQHIAQPWNGPLSLYSPFLIHMAGLVKKAGAQDRLTMVAGTGALHTWTDGSWHTALDGALAAGVVECLAVDGYAHSSNKWQSPQSIVAGVIAVARQVGLPWAWLEFGCSPFAGRPAWYDSVGTMLDAQGHDCKFVVTNANLAAYDPSTDAASFAAFTKMMSRFKQ